MKFGILIGVLALTVSANASENPQFIRKMKDIKNYKVDRDLLGLESLCGESDLQHVNNYDGTLGVTKDFVQKMKTPVAALAGSGNRKYCTGTMVEEDLFITAAHCVDSGITRDTVVFNYERKAGSTELEREVHVKILEIVEDGSANGFDYAVLRVEGAPGATWGFKPLNLENSKVNKKISIIQHPRGEAKQVEAGHVSSISGVRLYYGNLDTHPGSSGSGVMDSEGYLVGIHTNGGCHSTGGENSGVNLNRAAQKSRLLQRLSK